MRNFIDVMRLEMAGERARHEAHRTQGLGESAWDERTDALATRLHDLVLDEVQKAVKSGEVCLHMAAAATMKLRDRIVREQKAAHPIFVLAQVAGYEAATEIAREAGE